MDIITVVTAWYNISSKFQANVYREWFKLFFNIDCHLIIFTDSKSKADFIDLRNNNDKTLVLTLELEDFVTSEFDDFWKWCESVDIEKKQGINHTVDLYKIWAEKPFFLRRAISINPFNSKLFCWSDIGAVRSKDMFPKIKSFPQGLPKHVTNDQVLFSQIEPFKTEDYTIMSNGISKTFQNISSGCSCFSVIRIQGGFFAGYDQALLNYAELYYNELKLWRDNKVFAGKDQYLMANLVLKFGDLFFKLLAKDNKSYHNEWFSYLTRCSAEVSDEKQNTVSTVIQGGLGNQMFQVAVALALGWKWNANVCFKKEKPTGSNNITDRPGYWDSMFHRVNSKPDFSFSPKMIVEEWWNHQCSPLPQITTDTLLKGYFQSSYYFSVYAERLRQTFAPTHEQTEWVKARIGPGTIGIHVRRTDYVKLKWDLPLNYYTLCLNRVQQDQKIVIFSDDWDWCKSNFPTIPIFTEGNDVEQMFAMSACSTLIMANSSFSWWAAFLPSVWVGNDKKVFCPSPWFKSENFNNKIYEQTWTPVCY